MLPVLYEYNDFGMSIYDDRLNLIAEAPGLPIFVGSLDDCIERTLEAIGGKENLQPGDILVNNHPYLTAGQPADAALIEPIFLDGKLIAFGALRAHMGDLAAKGPYPTNSTEVYQEGLILPALKLYDAGRLERGHRQDPEGQLAAARRDRRELPRRSGRAARRQPRAQSRSSRSTGQTRTTRRSTSSSTTASGSPATGSRGSRTARTSTRTTSTTTEPFSTNPSTSVAR